MTVLDASALLAALRDEPGRSIVESLLRGKPPPSISALNLAEVAFKLERMAGAHHEAVRDRLDWLIVGGLQVEPLWLHAARRAGSLRSRYYDRQTAALSLADCVCLATATHLRTDLATSDRVLADLARRLGIEVIAVPDSMGALP